MATYAQRAQAIADAVINGTATQAQIDRIGAAIAYTTDQSAAYAAMTNAAKAQFLVTFIRGRVVGLVRDADIRAASLAAQSTAVADLPEAP